MAAWVGRIRLIPACAALVSATGNACSALNVAGLTLSLMEHLIQFGRREMPFSMGYPNLVQRQVLRYKLRDLARRVRCSCQQHRLESVVNFWFSTGFFSLA
jgi:hypothetical protein